MKRVTSLRTVTILTLAIFGVLLLPRYGSAQTTATPLSKYAWAQTGIATLAIAQGYLYREYVGTATTGNNLTDTCVSTPAPAVQSADCTAPIPPKSPGIYTVTITTTDTTQTPPAESAKSNSTTFTMQIVPNTPSNLHLVQLLQQLHGGKIVILASKRGLLHWKRGTLLGYIRP